MSSNKGGVQPNPAEHQTTEAALQVERQRLYDLFMNAPASIAVLSGADLVFELANPLYRKLLGVKRQIEGKPLLEVLPDIDQNLLETVRRVAFKGERFTANEIPVFLDWDDNGEPFTKHLNLLYEPIFNEKQQPNGLACFAIDITEQVLTRQKIQESEEKYRSLFEMMDQGFCIIEMMFDVKNEPLDYLFLETNPVFEKQTGLKNAVGKTARELVPTLETRWFELYGKVALTGDSTRFIEGSEVMGRWFEVFAFRIGGADSRKVALLFTDISERKNAEAERAQLLVQEQTARKAAEQSAAQIYLLQEVTSVLSQVTDMYELVDMVLEEAVPLLGAHIGTVLLVSEDGTTLQFVGQTGLSPAVLTQYPRFELSTQYPITDVVRSESPVWIERADAYAQQYPHLSQMYHTVTQTQAVAALPLLMNGKVGGVISFSYPYVKSFSLEERGLLLAIADQCAQAIERVRLSEKERALILLEERQRLARELHDSVTQTLFSATSIAESLIVGRKRNPEQTLQLMEQVVTLNRAALAEMRTLLLELRSEAIMRVKLSELLSQLIETVKGRKSIETDLIIEGVEAELPPDVHMAFYRIAQESLNNIVKHSQAKQVRMRLNQQPAHVTLQVIDDGKGFDPQQIAQGMGLVSMRERAQTIGATMQTISQPGQGTQIDVEWKA